MARVSAAEFLMENGVSNAVMNENLHSLQKLDNDNIKLFVIDNVYYTWVINNKFVLCNVFKLVGCDNVKSFLSHLKSSLSSVPRRRQVYYKLISFLNGEFHMKPEFINALFLDRERFNIDIVMSINTNSLIKYFTDITNNLEELIQRFHATTVGMTFIEVDCVNSVIRYCFSQYYKMIQSNLTCDDIEIDKYIKSISQGQNILKNCQVLMGIIGKKHGLLHTLITFIMKYFNLYGINDQMFTQSVLTMIYYKGISTSVKRIKSNTQKRPKVKRRKLTWRDKRPPRIKTDLPVSMPKIANKRRIEKLNKRVNT